MVPRGPGPPGRPSIVRKTIVLGWSCARQRNRDVDIEPADGGKQSQESSGPSRVNAPFVGDADLKEAKLEGAYLNGANLRDAGLEGANLQALYTMTRRPGRTASTP
jgi:hypothetical protein